MFEQTIRRLILSWLGAVTAQALMLPGELSGLECLSGLSPIRVAAVTVSIFFLFPRKPQWERWAMLGTFTVLAGCWLCRSYTPSFFFACWLILVGLSVYALYGWDGDPIACREAPEEPRYLRITVGLAAVFFLFLCLWSVCRVLSFSTPTYDFGIFAQMFHNMGETGLPVTTLERDGALSHFAVHVSPIYYLMLPGYLLFPSPITLQVMQAMVISSALIPLWLIAKHRGLLGYQRMLLCLLLMLSPAFAGGVGYDLHENCFLTPLLLWLLYFIEKRRSGLTILTAILVWMVKEDAAVYVAVTGLWLLLKKDSRGFFLLGGSVAWFLAVTGYLATQGDGVMTGRYDNFIYDGSGSLFTVVKAVVMNPMKAVYECVDEEKLSYIALTLGPLLGLPLITRRYERYVLLIPWVLVNLMSDYSYQHDIFFQYSFGSQAMLIYLTAVNLADLKWKKPAFIAAAVVAAVLFAGTVIPKAMIYPERLWENRERYTALNLTMARIPEDADVAATTFYTVPLSKREVLYDVKYCSRAHLLECEYVMLDAGDTAAYRRYGSLEGLIRFLEDEGYSLVEKTEYTLLYKKGLSQ